MLLNSKTLSNWMGKLSSSLSNIVDHAPNTAIWSILRRGRSAIESMKPQNQQFLACLDSDVDVYSEQIVTDLKVQKSYTSQQVEEIRNKGLFSLDQEVLVPRSSELGQALLDVYSHISAPVGVNMTAFRDGGLYWYPYVVSTTPVGIRGLAIIDSTTYNGNIIGYVQIVLATPSAVALRWTEMVPYINGSGSVLYASAISALPKIAFSTNDAYMKSLILGLVGVYSGSFAGRSTLGADWNESLAQVFLCGYSTDVDLRDSISFTDCAGHGYYLKLVRDGTPENKPVAYLWNDNFETPFVIFSSYSECPVVYSEVYDVDGNLMNLQSLSQSLHESFDMNGFISHAISIASLTDNTDVADISAMISSYAATTATVLKVLPQAVSAFMRGGFYGLAIWISGFFTATTSTATVDGNNYLEFTEASSWIPKEYISGIIKVVGEVLTAIGTAIIAFGSKILGAIVTVAGLVARFVSSMVNGAWDQARFQIVDDPKALEWCAPYAPFKGTKQLSSADLVYAPDCGEILKNPIYLTVPGGMLFLGAAAYNENSEITAFNWEFHPDCLNRRSIMYQFLSNVFEDYPTYVANFKSTGEYSFKSSMSGMLDLENAFVVFFNAHKDSFLSPDGTLSYSASTGYVSDANTNLMAQLCEVNSLVFALLIHLFSGMDLNWSQSLFTLHLSETHTGSKVLLTSFSQATQLGIDEYDKRYLAALPMMVLSACTPAPFFTDSYLPDFWGCSDDIGRFTDKTNTDDHYMGSFQPGSADGWANICSKFNIHGSYLSNFSPLVCIWYGYSLHGIEELPSSYKFGLKTPLYNRASIISAIALTIAVTAIVAGVVTVAAIKTSKALKLKRAQNNVKVEKAWSEAVNNPTVENTAAYYKAARKANFQSKLIGGQSYNVSGYWNGGESGSSIESYVSDLRDSIEGNLTDSELNSNANQSAIAADGNISRVISLISGITAQP